MSSTSTNLKQWSSPLSIHWKLEYRRKDHGSRVDGSATSAVREMDIPAGESVLSFSAPFSWTLSFRVIKRVHVVADTDAHARWPIIVL